MFQFDFITFIILFIVFFIMHAFNWQFNNVAITIKSKIIIKNILKYFFQVEKNIIHFYANNLQFN